MSGATARRGGRVCRIGADHALRICVSMWRGAQGKCGNSPRRGWSGPCFGCDEHLRVELVADIAAIASLTSTTAAPATADANAAGGTFAALLQLLQPSAGQLPNATPANDLGLPVAQNDNGANATNGQSPSGQTALANATVTASSITPSNLIALLQTGDANPPTATGAATTAPANAKQPSAPNDNVPNGQSAPSQDASGGAAATTITAAQPDLSALLQNGGTIPPATTGAAVTPPSATDQKTASTVATLQAQPGDTLAAEVQPPPQTATPSAAGPTGTTKTKPGAKDDQTNSKSTTPQAPPVDATAATVQTLVQLAATPVANTAAAAQATPNAQDKPADSTVAPAALQTAAASQPVAQTATPPSTGTTGSTKIKPGAKNDQKDSGGAAPQTPPAAATVASAQPAAQATPQPLVAAIAANQQAQSTPSNNGAATQIASVAAAGAASTPGSNSTAGTDATPGPNTSAGTNAQASVDAAVGNTNSKPALSPTGANPTSAPKVAKPLVPPGDPKAAGSANQPAGKSTGVSNPLQPHATKNDAAALNPSSSQTAAPVDSAPTSPSSASQAAPTQAAPSPATPSPATPSHAMPDPNAMAGIVQATPTAANTANVSTNVQVAPSHPADTSTSANIDTLGVAIAAKSSDGIKHFDIRLDPPELGRLDVRLSIGDDGKTQASLLVDKPQTLALLQRDAPNLHRALSNAGLDLSNNGLNFSLRGQDRQNDGGSVAKGRSRSLSVKAVVNTDAVSTSGSTDNYAPGGARLDIRV